MRPSPREIEDLLESIEKFTMSKPELVAFHYLCEYVEFGKFDGDRLFTLCELLVKGVLERNTK